MGSSQSGKKEEESDKTLIKESNNMASPSPANGKNDNEPKNEIHFEKPLKKTYTEIDSFIIYMCIEGHVHTFTDVEQFELHTGEVLLVPACISELNLIPEGKSRLLEVYL